MPLFGSHWKQWLARVAIATEGAQVRKDLGAAFGPRPMGYTVFQVIE